MDHEAVKDWICAFYVFYFTIRDIKDIEDLRCVSLPL